MSADRSGSPALRASDADRDRVIELLRAAELLTIRERHGSVRRDGRWTLPHRLVLRTAWSDVMLDLTSAVRSGPELIIELRMRHARIDTRWVEPRR